MALTRYPGTATPHQEIKVSPTVSLQNTLCIKMLVPAFHCRDRSLPGLAAQFQLSVRHVQMKFARFDVEFDEVAVAHQGQRTADGSFRCDVEDDRPESRP